MYAGVVRVVAVARSFESVSAGAAAAAIVYDVVVRVVVAVPACCRPSALNTRHKYIPGARYWPRLCFFRRAHTETGV